MTDNLDSTKSQYPNNVVTDNKKDTPFKDVHSTKIDGMWTLKHDIISPKFYEILAKTEIKGYTDLDLKNFYNYTKMFLNDLARLH